MLTVGYWIEGWSQYSQTVHILLPQQKRWNITLWMFGRWISWYDTIASWDKRPQKSGLTVRNDKYDRNGKEVKVILKKKCNEKNLNFVGNGNINPRILNKSNRYLNEYGTAKLVNNFCYTMKKGRDKICLGNDCRRKRNYLGSATLADL